MQFGRKVSSKVLWNGELLAKLCNSSNADRLGGECPHASAPFWESIEGYGLDNVKECGEGILMYCITTSLVLCVDGDL